MTTPDLPEEADAPEVPSPPEGRPAVTTEKPIVLHELAAELGEGVVLSCIGCTVYVEEDGTQVTREALADAVQRHAPAGADG